MGSRGVPVDRHSDSDTKSMKHYDPPGDIKRLRTFAVLLQRGEEVAVELVEPSLNRHGEYAVTIRADQATFWRTYSEIHAEQVQRDGEAWLRTQGGRR